jgi:hypothetical protein
MMTDQQWIHALNGMLWFAGAGLGAIVFFIVKGKLWRKK